MLPDEREPLSQILSELDSPNSLVQGVAIRKLPHNDQAAIAVPRLFKLMSDENEAIASPSRSVIHRLGSCSVPFLLEQLSSEKSEHRARAIDLLTGIGGRGAPMVRLSKQILDARSNDLPNWGRDPEIVFHHAEQMLNDDSLDVRFESASLLEEFGRRLNDTIPIFIETLSAGMQHQQNWAALRLGRIGPPAIAAMDALEAATHSKHRHTALAARNALDLIGESQDCS
jgi:HEAT repeat protein